VYVVPVSDDPGRFASGARLTHENGRALIVQESRPHRDRLLVKFEDVSSRDEAEDLRGTVFVDSAELRALGEDEFWEHDLIGCRVYDIGGDELGTIESVRSGRVQDLLVVSTPRGERLIPAVREIVVEIDAGARRVVLDPPPGLLD
jgi:16S rRNA processing protein RimM